MISFVKTLWSFYLGIGFMLGLGFSFVILVGSATISRYFKVKCENLMRQEINQIQAKRPMAIAFAMTGVPLMSIIFPMFYEFTYNEFGLYGGIAIIGALQGGDFGHEQSHF